MEVRIDKAGKRIFINVNFIYQPVVAIKTDFCFESDAQKSSLYMLVGELLRINFAFGNYIKGLMLQQLLEKGKRLFMLFCFCFKKNELMKILPYIFRFAFAYVYILSSFNNKIIQPPVFYFQCFFA